MSITFRLRKKGTKTLKKIQVDVSLNNQRFRFSTGLEVPRIADWSAASQTLKRPNEINEIKRHLSPIEYNRLKEKESLDLALNELRVAIQKELKEHGLDRSKIKMVIHDLSGIRKVEKEITEELAITRDNDKKDEELIENLGDSIVHWAVVKKNRVSHNHWRRHTSVLSRVMEYGNINLEKVNDKWLEDFVQSLVDDGMLNTSIGKYVSCIKNAVKLQGVDLNYKLDYKPLTTVIFLTEEVASIENHDVSGEMEIVKDGFLFECYTGMRFSDIEKFKHQGISVLNGSAVYRFVQTKTKKRHSIPLNSKALAIIGKYSGENCIPILSNQKMNKHLKTIGAQIKALDKDVVVNKQSGKKELIEIKKKYELLTTHVGRHTAACTWLMRGMPYAMVAAILGVDMKTLKVYIEITDESKVEAMHQFMN